MTGTVGEAIWQREAGGDERAPKWRLAHELMGFDVRVPALREAFRQRRAENGSARSAHGRKDS